MREMRNPFDRLSELSVDRPKATIAVAVIGILALSSFAQFIVFDNSEDAFYPENDTTDLLYEVEDTYTADVDLARAIVRLDSGMSLTDADAWALLANTEHELLTNPATIDHHYGLFGGAAELRASELSDILAEGAGPSVGLLVGRTQAVPHRGLQRR